MTLDCIKLRRAVTFMKYLANVVSLIFLPKTWNEATFLASNLLNFSELLENELMKSVFKKNLQYLFFQYCNVLLLIAKILRAYN